MIGASRVAFLAHFTDDPLYKRTNSTNFKGKESEELTVLDEDITEQDAWIESISRTGRVGIRFEFPIIVQNDISRMKERATG